MGYFCFEREKQSKKLKLFFENLLESIFIKIFMKLFNDTKIIQF
jgi:hypothetical protein